VQALNEIWEGWIPNTGKSAWRLWTDTLNLQLRMWLHILLNDDFFPKEKRKNSQKRKPIKIPVRSKDKSVLSGKFKGIQTTQESSKGRYLPGLVFLENRAAKWKLFFWVESLKISKFGLPFHIDKDSFFHQLGQ